MRVATASFTSFQSEYHHHHVAYARKKKKKTPAGHVMYVIGLANRLYWPSGVGSAHYKVRGRPTGHVYFAKRARLTNRTKPPSQRHPTHTHTYSSPFLPHPSFVNNTFTVHTRTMYIFLCYIYSYWDYDRIRHGNMCEFCWNTFDGVAVVEAVQKGRNEVVNKNCFWKGPKLFQPTGIPLFILRS